MQNKSKCWFLRRFEDQSTQSRVKNKQTRPIYDAKSRNQTKATLVRGECSHLCAIPGLVKECWEILIDSAGNNSQSSDIVRPNFENVRPISHYDRTWWPNISPAHLELSSTRRCQSMFYVRPNLSNVRPKGRFERTYVLWIKKNYFQHCIELVNESSSES